MGRVCTCCCSRPDIELNGEDLVESCPELMEDHGEENKKSETSKSCWSSIFGCSGSKNKSPQHDPVIFDKQSPNDGRLELVYSQSGWTSARAVVFGGGLDTLAQEQGPFLIEVLPQDPSQPPSVTSQSFQCDGEGFVVDFGCFIVVRRKGSVPVLRAPEEANFGKFKQKLEFWTEAEKEKK